MSRRGGVLLRLDGGPRATAVEEAIAVRAGFTDALSVADWSTERWEVCGLLLSEEVVSHWALARRRQRVATGKARVEFSRVTPTRVVLSDLRTASNTPLGNVGRRRSGPVTRFSPAAWDQLKEALRSVNPDALTTLERLESLRDQEDSGFDLPGAETLAQERDATGLMLGFFDGTGGLRRETLSRWSPTPRLRSFLDGLDGTHAIEDHHIAFDSRAFPNADEARPTILGSVFSFGGRILEAFNVNRLPIERTLGVDLLYYHEAFDAWTLIQYKVMEEHPKGAVFRIDNQFEQDLERMNRFRSHFPDFWNVAEGPSRYRLCGDGFYFKLCPRVQLNVLSSTLLSGMYLPRLYVESLLAGGSLVGPSGGRVMTFDNTVRHLTNTSFATLVREAWIGTRGLSSQEVGRLVTAGLNAGRSVVLGRARPLGVEADLQETTSLLGL